MTDDSSQPPWGKNSDQPFTPAPWDDAPEPAPVENGDQAPNDFEAPREFDGPQGTETPLEIETPSDPRERKPFASRGGDQQTPEIGGMVKLGTTPVWKIALRFFAPVIVVLIGFSLFNPFRTHAVIANYLGFETVMGFDSGLLVGIEEECEDKGLKIAEDGVQGWVTGADARWVIIAHVRCWAFVVIPYTVHFRFSNDLPFDGHTQRHLDNFVRDGWYFDRVIIEDYRRMVRTPAAEEYAKEAENYIQAPP